METVGGVESGRLSPVTSRGDFVPLEAVTSPTPEQTEPNRAHDVNLSRSMPATVCRAPGVPLTTGMANAWEAPPMLWPARRHDAKVASQLTDEMKE